jgi:hypothetical protein
MKKATPMVVIGLFEPGMKDDAGLSTEEFMESLEYADGFFDDNRLMCEKFLTPEEAETLARKILEKVKEARK